MGEVSARRICEHSKKSSAGFRVGCVTPPVDLFSFRAILHRPLLRESDLPAAQVDATAGRSQGPVNYDRMGAM